MRLVGWPERHWVLDLILYHANKVFLTVVTPRFRRCQPFFVSLRCFEDCPPEDVSLYEVLRCMRGGCGRRTFVVLCLVVSGFPFWPSSGSGGLLLLDMVVAPSGRVWGAWVMSGWGLGGVFELSWGGCEGRAPRCSLLEVSGRCGLPHRLVVWCVFPRWVRFLFRLGWYVGGVCLGPVVYLS